VDASHGYIHFTYSHLGFSNPLLRFNDFTVDLTLNNEDVAASEFKVEIDPASVDTGVERFDQHLKGDDFFNVAEYPTITFVSRGIEVQGDDTLLISGDLTIMDVTRSVQLTGHINKAGTNPINQKATVGVSAATTVKRSDFGLDKYVPAVSDAVKISIEVELQAR
jgi:polyisoprenoid-binding protein YceI